MNLRRTRSPQDVLRRVSAAVLFAAVGAAVHAGDWTAPALFEVTPLVVNTNPGAWTATIADGPANSWVSGGAFEPMVFRRKYHARGDSPNEIILNPSEIDGYNTYRDGFLEGATVRVYRVVNAAFTKVRTDTVLHYYSSGWYAPESFSYDAQIISPAVTRAELNFASWYRKPADYHFKVVAVDSQGNVSADSPVVTVAWNGWTGSAAAAANTVVAFAAPATPSETDAPAAPGNLQAAYNPVTGLIVLTWDAVSDPALAGYRLYYCDRPPAALNGYHIVLADSPADPDLHIKTGDMVFLEHTRTAWDKTVYLSHRVYGTTQEGLLPALVPYHNTTGKTWALVPHPGPVPAALAAVGGRTCLNLDVATTERIQLAQYNHADLQQSYYKVLQTGVTYVAECWLRQEGLPSGTVSFGLTGFYSSRVPMTAFAVTGEWQHYTTTFTVPVVYVGPGSVGQMKLEFNGPGRVWVDNFRVYEQGAAFMDYASAEYAALAESGLAFLRTHSHIKSGWGYTMDAFTSPRGVMGSRGQQTTGSQHTLESLLTIMHTAGINPWLQIEMYMSEDEWLAWVEYMAAPYDPGVDTPASKPWAYRRYRQGHPQPWTDLFDRFMFELSNETWNGLFAPWTFLGFTMPDHGAGGAYGSGQLYGMWQEYVYGVLRSSPYWTPAVDAKFEFVLGGWDAQRTSSGYGQQAGQFSSNSVHVTFAGYNGGWDEGEPPSEATDAGFFKTMAFAVQAGEPRAIEHAAVRDSLRAAGLADYVIGTYEAGPGYNLNGLNGVSMTAAQVEAETRVMKSLAGGVATLDAFLMRAVYGFDLQNFFTFERNRNYWVSHARWEKGGQAYPCWSGLSLYNLHGTGDHLWVHRLSSPTWDLPATAQRAALSGAPMTAVYATRDGDRWSVFCLSRKLDNYPVAGSDGYSPMTVRLPFALGPSGGITLYRMTGNPRTNNLDSAQISAEEVSLPPALFAQDFTLNAARGADDRGLPPGSIFLYVFDGAQAAVPPAAPQVRVEQATDQSDPADGNAANAVRFTVFFDRPVTGFGDSTDDVALGGSASAAGFTVQEVFGSLGAAYTVTVGPMLNAGTITAAVPAGAARSAADATACAASVSDDSEVTMLFPDGVALLEWEFQSQGVSFYQDPTNTYRHAWVASSVLRAGSGLNVGNNRYYNDDAFAATAAHSASLDPNDYLAWTLAVQPGLRVHLWRVRFGAFDAVTGDVLDMALRWSTNNFASYESVPLLPAAQITGAGLARTAGTALDGDLTAFSALQGVAAPVEFRLYLWNASGQYTACGIGKLGDAVADLQVKGMPEIVGANASPSFASDPLTASAWEDTPFVASLAGQAFDPDPGDILSFAKVSGPAWLAVGSDGSLSGTPGQADRGLNVFTVRVVDAGGGFAHAALRIAVGFDSDGMLIRFQ